ncbi:Metalloendoproteinase 1 [Heracleum sosnowskyi]|uniref:Metalloendoproteinase 1 n=1 Tax=Heracleum sosnowskyi TaxID=360622 RepID=A0AAD8MWG8_9APIA|nr:Metalloendoproteinase 1 [Heracleum sosnowskyi]
MAQTFLLIAWISLLFLLLGIPSNSENPTTRKPQPFGFLNHLQGCKKGENLAGLRELKEYLNKFGYLNYNSSKAHDNDDFDDFLEAAMKTYQANYNLKITGTLDSETLSKMVMPRCGVPDVVNGTSSMTKKKNRHHGHHHHSRKKFHTVSHYSFFRGYPRWPVGKTHLTYWFDLDTTHPDAIPAFVGAFDKWTLYSQYFTFEETLDYENSDIKIGFERGEHGDGNSFDGQGGVIAHAFAPTDGRFHCDADEFWSLGAIAGYYDLETVALHEIGHLIGLGHSSIEDAIMYPSIPSGVVKDLHDDDVRGIKALYNI